MLKLTTVFFLLTLVLLAGVHYLALSLHLYWRYLWLDIPMHFLGGMVVALGVFTLKDFLYTIPDRLQYFWPVISAVIVVSLLWELFELQIGVVQSEKNIFLDTAVDVAFGLAGGFVGFLIGHSIRKW